MPANDPSITLRAELDGAHPWTAEDPALYTLSLTIHDADGNDCETVTQRVGFRRFEILNSVFMLNGQRLISAASTVTSSAPVQVAQCQWRTW